MNALSKLFCGILAERLESWVNVNNILTEFQAGFRKNYSTTDHIFTLTSIVKAFHARNKNVFVCFVDFKSAFDLVNRNALFYKLSQIGLSTQFIHIIKEMYLNSQSAVWDGSIYSKWFTTNNGVKQGCLLSALLFSLFINDIVAYLPGGVRIAGMTIKVLLYADDLVLLSESAEVLQLMINRLSDYCRQWDLTINVNKSKVMVFSRTCRNQNRNYWNFNSHLLETVSDYKYLGVKLNTKLDFNEHLIEKTNSCQSMLNLSWKNVFSNQRIPLSAKYKIFDAVVKTTLCYSAQVWGADEYEAIEKFHRNFLKKLFNLPLTTPSYALYIETGLPKLYTSTLKSQADYIVKVLQHSDDRLTKKMLLYEVRNEDWWMEKWKNMAIRFEEVISLEANNWVELKEKLYRLISKHENSVRDDFKTNARNSHSRMLYSQLSMRTFQSNYFNDSLSYKEISLIFKARCEVLGLPYNGSFNQFCTLCNLKSKEDSFHFISICPIFASQRNSYFGKRTLSMQETIKLLNGTN